MDEITNRQEAARIVGLAADSIDELVCSYHPEGKFVITGCIPSQENLHRYECDTCIDLFIPKSTAYDCPECGCVAGMYREESLECYICGTVLGHKQ